MEKFDVFISFRGKDTRNTITSHLVDRLHREKVYTYTDNRLERGDEISSNLLKAIEESKLAIIMFSENYAFSSWCLDELLHILKCKGKNTETIIPIFYGIDPSCLRRKKGICKEAFDRHRERFKNDDKVDEWSKALETAANLSGIDYSKPIWPESNLVNKIVEDVLDKLNHLPLLRYDSSKLVGIDKHIKEIASMLYCDYRIIGIWGLIGIGKTTIAAAVFERFCSYFEGYYFLENVSEEAKTHGLSNLREKLLARLLGEENLNLGTRSSGSTFARHRLCRKKVLVVIDGVENEDQYNQLLSEAHVEFSSESRIIVTTRSEQVLKNIKADERYHVKDLNDDEAYQLLNLNAFDQNSNMSDYTELSKRKVIEYAGGVPLALEILCSYLRSHTTRKERESALEKLTLFRNQNIQNRMKVCYDQLDRAERKIFLDIACFFKGEDKDFIERILEGCELFPDIGIKNLIGKSLLFNKDHNKLWMHGLIQMVGQEIVEQESEEPGNRSRLWIAEDICDILEKDTGTAKVEGIFLDLANSKEVHISATAFSKMHKLRLLKIYNSRTINECMVYCRQGLQSLPNSLVYFHWHAYPLKSLPSRFAPNNLVEFHMPYSMVKKLWPPEMVQHLGKLRKINLSYSKKLTQISNLSQAPNIEIIDLECCTSLVELPLSKDNLDKLTSLNLKSCSSLREFSAFPRKIKSLDMRKCLKLETLPNNVCDLEALWHLNLSGCCKLRNLPPILKQMPRLRDLVLDRTAIEELPPSIKNLTGLRLLSLNMCGNLQFFPSTVSCLYHLERLSLCHCSKLKSLPELPSSLSWLDARYCTLLETVPSSKAPTQTWTDIGYNCRKFLFYNCPNLDQNSRNNIMIDAQLKILHSAMATREYGQSDELPDDEICFPGSEVPPWFNYQSEGCEINIALPPCWCNSNFLGFAFCVVVQFSDNWFHEDFKLSCQSECIFPDGETNNKWRRTWTWHCSYYDPEYGDNQEQSDNVKSSHVFLFYDYCCHKYFNFPIDCEASSSTCTRHYDNPSATFSFRPGEYREPVNTCQVQWCGVRLLYADDLPKIGLTYRDVRHSEIEEDPPHEIICLDSNEVNNSITHYTVMDHFKRNSSSCECLSFCPEFGEICDRILGKTPRFVNAFQYELSPELQKRLLKMEDDVHSLHSRVDELGEQSKEILQLMQQLINRVPRPIPQFPMHNSAQPISF